MPRKSTKWRTFLYISLVYAGFGMILGLVIGFAAMIIGSLLFTFENKYTPIIIFSFSVLGSSLLGLIGGAFSERTAHRQSKQQISSFLGNSPVEITTDIMRSASGTKQLRLTKTDFLEHHHHLEILDSNSLYILENNVYGEINSIHLKKQKYQWVAIIAEVSSKVSHFSGLPPELTNNSDNRIQLPTPQIIAIEQIDSDVFLSRITKAGEYAGDTWHQSVEHAKKQAAFEYGITSDAWQIVPSDIDNIIQFTYEYNQKN